MYFKIFNSCKTVNGHFKSLLLDLDNNSYFPLHPIIGNYLIQNRGIIPMEEVQDLETQKYIDQLKDLNLGFYTSNPESFCHTMNEKELDENILDVTIHYNNVEISRALFSWLSNSSCKGINLIVASNIEPGQITIFLQECMRMIDLQFIMILIEDSNSLSFEILKSWINSFPLIGMILVHKNKKSKLTIEDNGLAELPCYFINEEVKFNSIKAVDQNRFVINKTFFNMSRNKNNYHFGHLYIDCNGTIYNDEYNLNIFGNIFKDKAKDIIEKPGFKKYWDITKDKIHVCKDCEFRYICTDCRAYVEDPDDIYSKPLKCGYNPYTGEWSEWSTNPLKQKAIDFYGMREMVDGMNKNADNPSSNNKTL